MLQNALDILRKEGKEILVCLSGSEEAQKAWLAAGGEAGHMLSHRQVESWLMTGGAQLPKEIAFPVRWKNLFPSFPRQTPRTANGK